jgi:hypothetical protein
VFIVFVAFFVFILLPHHKSRESVKIRPHPWVQPLSASIGRVQATKDKPLGSEESSSSDNWSERPPRWRLSTRCLVGRESHKQ